MAQIDSVNQLKSDICKVPYKTLKNFESTSLGALLIVLKVSGFYKEISEASKDIIKFRKSYEPNLKFSNYFDDLYNLSKEVSTSLKGSFERRKI